MVAYSFIKKFHGYLQVKVFTLIFALLLKKKIAFSELIGEVPEWPKGTVC